MKLSMPQFNLARVFVVGDIMLDRFWQGPTSRISPEAPVPVVRVEEIIDKPGGAGNVALNISALGAAASLRAYTGDDEMAESLEDMLCGAGVECLFEREVGRATTTKLRVISRHQQLIRLDFEDTVPAKHSAGLEQGVQERLQQCGALVLSDYAKGALDDPSAIIAAGRAAGLPVLVDPKGDDFARYRGATLLTPNLHEFEAVVGQCPTEKDLTERGEALMSELELGALLVTRGEQGMTLLRPGMKEMHLPARAREVFDVTGAGDTVIAVLATAIAAGEDLPQAVALANIAASIVVGKLGTATVSAPELRRAVQADHGPERGVVTLEQLQMAVADARSHGEKLVFTNGCFDIIHAGHVGYLDDARQLGDRLIVAVNSDASVRKLKGKGRPINREERRMAVLAGLESVDWVVCFSEDTPEHLLHALQPEVVVKGGDYDRKGVVGWEIVESYGGEVKVLDFLDNVSTTAIVNKIQENTEE